MTSSARPWPRASYRAATALRWSLVPRNVADAVDAPRVRRAERPVLSEGQVGQLLDALRDDRLYSLTSWPWTPACGRASCRAALD